MGKSRQYARTMVNVSGVMKGLRKKSRENAINRNTQKLRILFSHQQNRHDKERISELENISIL